MSDIKTRMQSLIKTLTTGLHERDEQMAVALLAALAGLNVFLLGPPGTAKSLLARRLKSAFADCQEKDKYFEYLMQRFSTPDELFGPVSISALKEDRYERKTEGFLPSAHFAFLDEIWKSGPGILNALLTLINEKLFRNGAETIEVPLKALIAASNETPEKGKGLEALYDRFVVRMFVPPMEKVENFESLLKSQTVESHVDCKNMIITAEELKKWRKEIQEVNLSAETLLIIRAIRVVLGTSTEEEGLGIYVSERRWKQATNLIKAAAFFCGRKETNLSDVLLLQHCLWETAANREEVMNLVKHAVRKSGFKAGVSDEEIINEKDGLDKEIQKEFSYGEDEYDTVLIYGKYCVKGTVAWSATFPNDVMEISYEEHHLKKTDFYIPIEEKIHSNEFYAMDTSGNKQHQVVFWFDQRGSCWVKKAENNENHLYLYEKSKKGRDKKSKMKISLPVKHHKGDKKIVSRRLIDSLQGAIGETAEKFDKLIGEIDGHRQAFSAEMDTPFVAPEQQRIALAGVDEQIKNMRVHREDCDRLLEKINPSTTK